MEMKFYKCPHCGNVLAYVQPSGVKAVCCGDEVAEMVPKTADSAKEKHVPVIEQDGSLVTVTVGSTLHPMEEKHSIQWIALHTEQGNQRKALKPGDAPRAVFALAPGDRVVAAYEYCDLHGLWRA